MPSRSVVPPWLPNAITALRIVLIPVFLFFATRSPVSRGLCIAVLLALGISDVIDGWLARRYALATRLGATLDAAADKLAQVALLGFFAFFAGPTFQEIPVWFLTVIVARDVVLAVGWLVIRRTQGNVRVVHEHHGKAASLMLFVFLLWVTAGLPDLAMQTVMWGITGVVVFSTALYVRKGLRQLRHQTAASVRES